MGTTPTYAFPFPSGTDSPNGPDQIEDLALAVEDKLDGNLDNSNLDGSAGITDANLASPNNGVYRTLLHAGGRITGDAGIVEGSYDGLLGWGGVVDFISPQVELFGSTDLVVAGKTAEVRIKAQVSTRTTAPTVTTTVSLVPVAVIGGVFVPGTALGTTSAAGTTVANSLVTVTGIVTGLTTNTFYALRAATGSAPAANSEIRVTADLQIRWV